MEESAFRTMTEVGWTLEEAGAFHCLPVLPDRARMVPHHDGPARQEHQQVSQARHHVGVEPMTHLKKLHGALVPLTQEPAQAQAQAQEPAQAQVQEPAQEPAQAQVQEPAQAQARTQPQVQEPAQAQAQAQARTQPQVQEPAQASSSSPASWHRAPQVVRPASGPPAQPCAAPGPPEARPCQRSGSWYPLRGNCRGRGPLRWSSQVLAPTRRRGCFSALWF